MPSRPSQRMYELTDTSRNEEDTSAKDYDNSPVTEVFGEKDVYHGSSTSGPQRFYSDVVNTSQVGNLPSSAVLMDIARQSSVYTNSHSTYTDARPRNTYTDARPQNTYITQRTMNTRPSLGSSEARSEQLINDQTSLSQGLMKNQTSLPQGLIRDDSSLSQGLGLETHRFNQESYYPSTMQQQRRKPEISTATEKDNKIPARNESQQSDLDELESLELQLKILKAKEEIRNTKHRLTLEPTSGTLRRSDLNPTSHGESSEITQVLSLVKRSVDISGLPPARPMMFSGNPLDYSLWSSSFDLLIENKDLSAAQRFSYLQSYLTGKALKCVQGYIMLNSEEAYTEARKSLKERFGDPFLVSDAFRDELESWPKIGSFDCEGLRDYADFLKQCKLAMTEIPELKKLDDARELKHLVNCLPKHIITRWSREAGLKKLESKVNPVFSDYANFVMKEALLACDTTTSLEVLTSNKKETSSKRNRAETKHNVSLSTEVAQVKQERPLTSGSNKFCILCQNKTHFTSECRRIAKMTKDGLQEFMSKERLCFKCLSKGHFQPECIKDVKCNFKNCGGNHPTCTHKWRAKETYTGNSSKSSDVGTSEATVHKVGISGHGKSQLKTLTSMIIPVYVSSAEEPSEEILTYALIDTMSDTSIILKDVCDSLVTSKVKKKVQISTVTTSKLVQWCDEICDLRVRGYNSDESGVVSIPTVYTQDDIPVNRDHIPTPETATTWKHLRPVADKLIPLQDCEVGLIIGYNCSAASFPIATVKHQSDMTLPYAVQTVLGWSVVGGFERSQIHTSHRIQVQDQTKQEVLQCIEDDLSVIHDKPPRSQEDLSFIKKMDQSITQVNGYYTMPLPFRETPIFCNNRSYAMRRFNSLESKLKSNAVLKHKYTEFMRDIFDKGEAEEVKDVAESGWYIPHHGVFHPRKPEKLRVVFDCSASFRGHSLNKDLLQGPNLNSSLAGLLCRFRKEKVAVTCDIKKMFHQFRVTDNDRKYLRFLWYKNNTDEVRDYQMNVHLFGAASSPSCAIYGLQKLADDHSTEFPEASSFVKNNFYVDDGLASVATVSEAIKLIKDTKTMMARGNLVLHKFLSNNYDVAQALECDGPENKIFAEEPSIDRCLGLCWNIKDDAFKFSEIPIKPPSRRGILSTVASLYDPLGFLTPFSLKGKLLLQSLCYDQKGWDDPLSSDHKLEWSRWTSSLPNLFNLHINRCFLDSQIGKPYTVELHTFSDASTVAYGVCSYIRIMNQESKAVSVSLVMGKSRVAPRKVVTIPRLELQAATLAVKVGDFLKRELRYTDMATYYWTDSKTVLGYIANESKRFHVFVCNRVQRIKDSTKLENWSYVSTKENPADVASRGGYVEDISQSWFHGPSFLHDSEFISSQHMLKRSYKVNPQDPEIKKVFSHALTQCEDFVVYSALEKHSAWIKICTVFSFILKFATKDKTQDYTPLGKNVFKSIIKLMQQRYYSDEINLLRKKQAIPKNSSLFNLDAFLDEENVLRVGGRLQNALSSYEQRHPAVLPSKSSLAKSFVRHQHKEVAHQGRSTTANAIRLQGIYLVSNGTRMISSIIFNCVRCRQLRGKPSIQKMADLPRERIEPSAPFTYTGMDVFGPFVVKDGRKENKRYGLMLTCMSSRAIHLELLIDMTTDCLINSLRSFMAIRGPVQTLYSDRGTNFVGAKNELQNSLLQMTDIKIQQFLESKQCCFSFNVPAASHMGGIWERMIRTVRNVLNGILIEKFTSRLDTTNLRTLLYECMYIVNSRPLTVHQLSSPKAEPLPLTPNNLLTMKDHTLLPPPGRFEEPDMYSRKRWRRIQYLVEQFWSRWRVEYLQSLHQRSKWVQPKRNYEVDDIVLLKEDNLPRSAWKLGRIIEVLPSKDQLIRKVLIKTGTGQLLERPIHKLILMIPSAHVSEKT